MPTTYIESGQALLSVASNSQKGLVPASAAQSADADFHSHLPRRRDSQPSCPLRFPEVRETLEAAEPPAGAEGAGRMPLEVAVSAADWG